MDRIIRFRCQAAQKSTTNQKEKCNRTYTENTIRYILNRGKASVRKGKQPEITNIWTQGSRCDTTQSSSVVSDRQAEARLASGDNATNAVWVHSSATAEDLEMEIDGEAGSTNNTVEEAQLEGREQTPTDEIYLRTIMLLSAKIESINMAVSQLTTICTSIRTELTQLRHQMQRPSPTAATPIAMRQVVDPPVGNMAPQLATNKQHSPTATLISNQSGQRERRDTITSPIVPQTPETKEREWERIGNEDSQESIPSSQVATNQAPYANAVKGTNGRTQANRQEGNSGTAPSHRPGSQSTDPWILHTASPQRRVDNDENSMNGPEPSNQQDRNQREEERANFLKEKTAELRRTPSHKWDHFLPTDFINKHVVCRRVPINQVRTILADIGISRDHVINIHFIGRSLMEVLIPVQHLLFVSKTLEQANMYMRMPSNPQYHQGLGRCFADLDEDSQTAMLTNKAYYQILRQIHKPNCQSRWYWIYGKQLGLNFPDFEQSLVLHQKTYKTHRAVPEAQ
ncbi:hypothetical protein K7432_012848 [Basidiobolus ranarum]|uniref:Uncharacterized protein n=1 Tax=Basidiobolus ranarum TaxID=34480 RepID=A0ABR2WK60_9FUNG